MKRTKVFYKIRAAIHAKNPDGSRKYKYILLTGSSRSSKTTSAIQNFYSEAWNEDNKRYSVWRDTKKDCRDTVGNDMAKNVFPDMPYYSPNIVQFNKTEAIYSFPSGSAIEICGTDDHKKVHGFNGYGLWLNEPYNISKETFDQLDQRTEGFVIIDLNPLENHWSDDLAKDPRCKVIHSTFLDNPYCPDEQKRKILSYQPVKMCQIVIDKLLTEIEAKEYNITENKLQFPKKLLTELERCKENEHKRSANAFNWSVYGLGLKAERPNRIFHWEEISDDEYNKIDATKYYGVDWGTVDPFGVLEAKYYDGALYLHELNYKSENQLKEEMPQEELIRIMDDPEGGIVRWLFSKLNVNKKSYILCDTNRPLKTTALIMAGYDYAMSAPKPPGSIIDGIDLINELRVYFTSSSKNIKYEQENYSRKVDRYGIVEQEPEDKYNHLCDPTRYIALFLQMMEIIKK